MNDRLIRLTGTSVERLPSHEMAIETGTRAPHRARTAGSPRTGSGRVTGSRNVAGGCRPCRTARTRQRGTDRGGYARGVVLDCARATPAGRALRLAHAAQSPGLQRGGNPVIGAGYRRQYGHLQPDRRAVAAVAAGSQPGPTGAI